MAALFKTLKMNIGKSSLEVDNYFDLDNQVEFRIGGDDYLATWLTKDEIIDLVKYLNDLLECNKDI